MNDNATIEYNWYGGLDLRGLNYGKSNKGAIMKIKRAWKSKTGVVECKEISEDRASRELANKYGDDALSKLKESGELETRFAVYKIEN